MIIQLLALVLVAQARYADMPGADPCEPKTYDRINCAEREAWKKTRAGLPVCLSELANAGWDIAKFEVVGTELRSPELTCKCEEADTRPHVGQCRKN